MKKEILINSASGGGHPSASAVTPSGPAESAISDDRLREFAEAYREEFDEEISLNEARTMLSQLVEFYHHISHRLPNDPGMTPHKDDGHDG